MSLRRYRARSDSARAIKDPQMPKGVLVIGLLARLVLAPYTSWNNDVAVWFQTSLSGYHGLHLYDRPGFSYPPLWGYLLQILGSLVRLAGFGPNFFGVENSSFASASSVTADFTEFVTSPAFNLLFKSVLFGFDLVTAVLVYRFVRYVTGDPRRASLSLVAWFLNPFVIYESAVHGALDTIVGFAVLSTVVLVVSGRRFWGGAAWAIGIIAKLSPVVLAPLLLITIAMERGPGSTRYRFGQIGLFAYGASVATLCLLAPLAIVGSIQAMYHNVFARTMEAVTIGGLSLTGIRYLGPWSGLLIWAFDNSAVVIRASFIAQSIAIVAWSGWTAVMVRRDPIFGLLSGSVGALTSIMLLSPISNPQYVLWWLPALIVLVFITGQGYWQLALLTIAPLTFCLAILGPAAVLGPLSTYTHVISASAVNDDVIRWYLAPRRLWGASLADDFFAPASLVTVAAVFWLFALWIRMALREEESSWRLSRGGVDVG
jgi:Glycosyltransferase family 87